MKNLFERIPFIFSLQQAEVLDLTKDDLNLSTDNLTSYRESDLTKNVLEDDPTGQENRDIDPVENLPVYSMDEVSYHDTFDDCWIILYDKIYDITRFLQEHPGGEDVLMEYAGRDATISFRSVGHSKGALKALEEYIIGVIPDEQRLFPKDSENQWSIV